MECGLGQRLARGIPAGSDFAITTSVLIGISDEGIAMDDPTPASTADNPKTVAYTLYWFFVILSVPAIIMFLFLITGYLG